jgi:uncharacterized membrane protein
MKWSKTKLSTASTISDYQQDASLAVKRNHFARKGSKIRRWIVDGCKKRNTYVEIICGLFIILFIYTGLNKMTDHETFISQLKKSPFMQWGYEFVSYAIPVGELLLALGLIIKKTRMISLYGSFLLMAIFTGYIWIMLTYANDLPCSCGGILAAMSWNTHLIFNAVFTIMAMSAIILQGKNA